MDQVGKLVFGIRATTEESHFVFDEGLDTAHRKVVSQQRVGPEKNFSSRCASDSYPSSSWHLFK